MSALDRITLKEKFNNASTGLFKTGQSRGIGSDDQRTQVEDQADSHFNLIDEAYTGAKGLKNSINTIAGLKAIVTVGLSVPLYTVFRDTGNGDVLRVYELVSGTDSESTPDIIRPDDYASSTNEKVWKLAIPAEDNLTDYNASGGTFPTSPRRGQRYQITTAGTLGGEYLVPGVWIAARQASPSDDYTITGWKIL